MDGWGALLGQIGSGIASGGFSALGQIGGSLLNDALGIGASQQEKQFTNTLNQITNQGNNLWNSAFFNAAGDTGAQNVHNTFAQKMGGPREYASNIGEYNRARTTADQLAGNAERNAANILNLANRDIGNQQGQMMDALRNSGASPSAIGAVLGKQNMGDMYAKILGQAGANYSNDLSQSQNMLNQALQLRNQGRDIFRTTEIDPYRAQIDQSKVSSILGPAVSGGSTTMTSMSKQPNNLLGGLTGSFAAQSGDYAGYSARDFAKPNAQVSTGWQPNMDIYNKRLGIE